MTYFTEDKRYVAGMIHTYQLAKAEPPVYGLQFYPAGRHPRSRWSSTRVRLVQAKITDPGRPLRVRRHRLAADDRDRRRRARRGRDRGRCTHRPGPRRDQVPAAQPGRGLGLPADLPARTSATLAPTDIPVFDELPLDLSVVAGVITQRCRTPTRT